MPRTKISKSSKRNREASQREEKIREYEAAIDHYITSLDTVGAEAISEVDLQIKFLQRRIKKNLLQMKFRDFLELNLRIFDNCTPLSVPDCSISNIRPSVCSSISSTTKVCNPNDEGYLTEDSASCGNAAAGLLAIVPNMIESQQRGRTPGPLSSAKASRSRRSKSFCGNHLPGSVVKVPPSHSAQQAEHASRSRMRTPLASRTKVKAISADRTFKTVSPSSPPTAFIRWPRPGELVMSVSGSPVVAQVMPDKFANVNIPVKNGVLSLRPKKLSELKPEFVEAIDEDTLNQIKTLHANLNLIMNMADKVAFN